MLHLEHPYEHLTGGQWRRGNLHAHSTRSDGQRAPQAVVDDYAARGYDFLMLSDHDVFADPAFYATLNARGLTLLPGNEVTAVGPHLLQVGGTRLLTPHKDRQAVISAGVADGAVMVVNHPNWFARFDHCPQELLDIWQGYAGLEIYNGVIGRLDGSSYASDRWDMMLAAGRRVWGFANDDSHLAEGETGLGWNMVYSADASPAAIIDAMRAGRFYASTGVVITQLQVDGLRVTIKTANADRIVAMCATGRRVAVADAPTLTYEVTDPACKYLRFECWGRGEQFAWTQPFFVVAD